MVLIEIDEGYFQGIGITHEVYGAVAAGVVGRAVFRRRHAAPWVDVDPPEDLGTVVSFELRGGHAAASAFMRALRLITPAVSLGSTDSLIQHPAGLTHRAMDPSVRDALGITDGLLRLSHVSRYHGAPHSRHHRRFSSRQLYGTVSRPRTFGGSRAGKVSVPRPLNVQILFRFRSSWLASLSTN